jgi:MFS family permease
MDALTPTKGVTVAPRVAPTVATGEQVEPPGRRAAFVRRLIPTVSRTVWALGLTSLLTDISSEMVASVLPLYLVVYLGISPLAFGLADGLYQGAAALFRLVGGVFSDRWRRHKEVAIAGYAVSAACRLLFLAAGNAWGAIAAVIALERIGKGIRTAPRDALIAQSSPSRQLATAFGVHRAMDAAGAMLGPVVAFVLLAMLPGNFDVVLVASFGVAVVGVAAIVLFVPAPAAGSSADLSAVRALKLGGFLRCRNCPTPGAHCEKPASLREAMRLLADARFRNVVLAGCMLGVATISDSFIYLILQRRLGVAMSAFPLLYVATSLGNSVFAIPFGRIADRFGRSRMLVAGYGLLALVYTLLLLSDAGGWVLATGAILLLGMYYAATDGVLTAVAASTLPHAQAASGLAVLATGTNIARMFASLAFGFVWMRAGIGQATAWYLGALMVAIVATVLVLGRDSPARQIIAGEQL